MLTCPVCLGPYTDWPRCNRGDCHDGRWKPLTVEAPMPGSPDIYSTPRTDAASPPLWSYTSQYPVPPSGADNPAPLADVVGVPGGPQPRYNPFTDGPRPAAGSWWRKYGPPPADNDLDPMWLGLCMMVSAFVFGVGLGCLAVWAF